MRTQEITIRVAPEAASVYRSSSEEKKRKLDALLSAWLTDAGKSVCPLKEVRRDATEQARKNGLTPETLSDILWMSNRRFVFGTNTIVGAFLFENGKPGRALDLTEEQGRPATPPTRTGSRRGRAFSSSMRSGRCRKREMRWLRCART